MNAEETNVFRIKNWWKNRSKLEQKLIGSFIVVVLVLVALLLYVIIKNATAPKICKTTACITAASEIVNHIDPKIDPCDNFFKFACGKFFENSHGDLKTAAIMKQKEQIERQITEMMKEPIKDSDPYWVREEKQFLNVCMNATEGDAEKTVEVLQKTFKEVNGWPVIEGNNWKDKLFDWKEMIYKLRRKGYFYRTMLNVEVISDYNNTNKHIIKISEPYIALIDDDNKLLYKQFMVNVAQYLGANKGRADIDMGNVLNFVEKLAEVVSKNSWADQPEDDAEMIKNVTRFTIRQFQFENGELNWLEYINNIIHPVAKLTLDDYVLFPRKEFLDAFFNLIFKTDKRIIANYIIWNIVEGSVRFMPKDVQQFKKEYACLTDGLPKNAEDRFKFCKVQAKKSFYPSPLQIMHTRKYLPRKQREKITKLVDSIKLEFVSLLHTNSWMDEDSRRKALEKIDALVEIIGAPGNYFGDSVMEQIPRTEIDFQNEETQKNVSFFQMVLNNTRRLNDAIYFKIHMNVNDTKRDIFYNYIMDVDAMYSAVHNVILLPVGILQGGFYDPDRPMYLNYGAIGSIIGHELTHGFTRVASKYDKNGLKIDVWSKKTEKAFDEKIKCIEKEANEFDVENSEEKINGTLTSEENIADYTGLRVSYAAYKKWVLQNGDEPQLTGIDYTPNQLFWISATTYECFHDAENVKKDNLHAHNSFRVIAPLRNNPDFVKDFNCPVGSRMNPPEKCQVF